MLEKATVAFRVAETIDAAVTSAVTSVCMVDHQSDKTCVYIILVTIGSIQLEKLDE